MATRYWVGGTGTWDTTTTTNWSTTSGGGGGASAPGFADNVIIDTASSPAGFYLITCASGVCLNLTVTATQGIILGGNFGTLTVGGDLTLPSGGSFTAANHNWTLTLASVAGVQTVTTNGKTLSSVTINSFAGVSLADSLTTINTPGAGRITLTKGTFTTNNNAVNCGYFLYTNSGFASALVLGSSTFTLTNSGFDVSGSTNLTITAGTSTIVIYSTTGAFFAATGQTFYNVTFDQPGLGFTQNIAGTGYTISNNLTVSGSVAGFFSGIAFNTASAVITIGGSFISARTGPTQRVTLIGTLGSPPTLNVAAASLSDVDFSDINVTGAASPISGTRLGDRKGNSGVTFSTPKTVYWNLAGTQNWSATAWATSSGGTPNINNFPLAQDTAVFYDAGAATTVSGSTTWVVGTISTGSRTTALTINSSGLGVYGDIILGSGVNLTTGNANPIYIYGRTTQTITSNGRTVNTNVYVSSVGGTLTFADNFIIGSSYSLSLQAGTIDANNKDLNIGVFVAVASSSTKILNMGSGTWTLSRSLTTVWDVIQGLTTLNANTSTINIAGSSTTFAGNGYTYNNINIGASNTGTTFTGTNTFNTLSSSRTAAYNISFGANQTFANWTANGTAGNLITLGSTVSGTQRTITKTGGGTISINYIRVQDSNAQPVSTWSAPVGSVNLGNNLNWTFNAFASAVTENVNFNNTQLGPATFRPVVTETNTLADNINSLRTAITSISEAISSCSDTPSALAAFIAAVSEGLTANNINDEGFVFYREVIESVTLADIEAAVRIHNATAVEPVNVADVAQCFGFGTIDNTQDVVWVQVDNRQ
jgi:hypothetical protein